MAISAFNDKQQQPTMKEIFTALGSRRPLWEKLAEFISENYGLQGEFKCGPKNYGWVIWFRKSGKTIVTLYPGKEYFTVQIVLGDAQAQDALRAPLGKRMKKVVAETRQFHDGRWLFLKVASQRELDDVSKLLLIKAPPPRRKLPAAA
jgi:hypothetical protein